jgi:hypothetical protein
MKTKLVNGQQCYFDLMGNTNRTDIDVCTVIKKKPFRNYYTVLFDNTKEIATVPRRILTPIDLNNGSKIHVTHQINPMNNITFEIKDHLMLHSLIDLFEGLKTAIADYENNQEAIKKIFGDSFTVDTILMSLRLLDSKIHHCVAVNDDLSIVRSKRILQSYQAADMEKNSTQPTQPTGEGSNNTIFNGPINKDIKKIHEIEEGISKGNFSCIEDIAEFICKEYPINLLINHIHEPQVYSKRTIREFSSDILLSLNNSEEEDAAVAFLYLPRPDKKNYILFKKSDDLDEDDIFDKVYDLVKRSNMINFLLSRGFKLKSVDPSEAFFTPYKLMYVVIHREGGFDFDE